MILVIIYGLEVCPLNISDLRSLDFVVNNFFMEMFNTNVIDNVKLCQDYFWWFWSAQRNGWKAEKDILARFDIVEKSSC